MSSKIFDVFEEYAPLCDKGKFTLAGGKDWSWFNIYVFTKEEIDLVEELDKLSSLLTKNELFEYGEFSVCLDQFLWPNKAFAFLTKKKTKKERNNVYVNI